MTQPLAVVLASRCPPLAIHITFRLEGDRLLAETAAQRRLLARVILEHGEAHGLLAFGAADNHLHVLIACDRVQAGRWSRSLATALRKRLHLQAAFQPSRFTPIDDQRHLMNAFRYVLRQQIHHGIDLDPHQEATLLPDLLGARVIFAGGGRRVLVTEPVALVRRRLPRIRWSALLEEIGGRCLLAALGGDAAVIGTRITATGAPPSHAAPAPDPPPSAGGSSSNPAAHWTGGDDDVVLSLDDLGDAAAAAVGLPDLQANDGAASLARCAAVRVARSTLSHRAIADLMRVPLRTIQRDAVTASRPPIVRAVELQLRMRAFLATSPPPA